MRLGAIRPGDIVFVERLGRRFYALVRGAITGGLQIQPLDRRITYHQVKAREVLEHFARQGRPRPGEGEPIDGQLTLEHERQLAGEWKE